MYAGVRNKTCRYRSSTSHQSEESILEGPMLNNNIKLCQMSFSHYRSLPFNYYRGKYNMFCHVCLICKADIMLTV